MADGPVLAFLKKHRIIRRAALIGGALVGLYLIGAKQGWWERFLF
jgi:hypothetical protein